MSIPSYPLQWPAGWQRTPLAAREYGRFNARTQAAGYAFTSKRKLTIAEAVQRLRAQLRMIGAGDDDAVISSNLQLRLDGLPRSGQAEPDDPGAAVYWRTRAGDLRCMAIDNYQTVADNIAAIAATLDAMRAIRRHGGAEILDRAFTGFAALPPPEDSVDWRQALGFAPGSIITIDDAAAAYRRRRAETHPDRGGNPAEFIVVQKAYEQACAELP